MLTHMNSYYEEMQKKEGINSGFLDIDTDANIYRIEQVIRNMKPNCKAKTLKST